MTPWIIGAAVVVVLAAGGMLWLVYDWYRGTPK